MSKPAEIIIGVSMRETTAEGYDELRDTLARDWGTFMPKVLPEARWIALPNVGGAVVDIVKSWGVNAFILTGGNDLGSAPQRDQTEIAVLEYATFEKHPVLGVCRGLQLMWKQLGGGIIRCPNGGHAGTNHNVRIVDAPFKNEDGIMAVNSYHDQCCGTPANKPSGVNVWATSDDGLIEGIYSVKYRWLGVMWHPERKDPAWQFDQRLIRQFFSLA